MALGDLEREVMSQLWDAPEPLTVRQVHERLSAGRDLAYTLNSPAGYGFTGIAIALLGRNHPIGMMFGAVLWGFLERSAQILDLNDIPKEIIDIMQATILLSVVVSYEVVHRMVATAEVKAAADATHGMATQPARTAVLSEEGQ